MEFAASVSAKLNLRVQDVTAVLQLLEEGATIPFIARYRKDKTGALQNIQDEAKFQKEFSERKAFIEKTITEQGKMTEALQEKINKATTIAELEDIYGTSLHYKHEINDLKCIDPNWDKEKIERHIRATSMPGFEPPYYMENGKKMYFSQEQA